MISRIILLCVALLAGLMAFFTGIVSGDFTIMMIGFLASAIPGIFFGILFFRKYKQVSARIFNKGKFKTIYKLLPQETFLEHSPANSDLPTKRSAYVAYHAVRGSYNKKERLKKIDTYKSEREIDDFFRSCLSVYQSPEKINEHLFTTEKRFDCDESVFLRVKESAKALLDRFNKKICKVYKALFKDYDEREQSALRYNSSVIANHQEKETTGLGFGLITNSATHAITYAAMDADERQYQRLSSMPQLVNTEEEDNDNLKKAYDEIICAYNEYIVSLRELLLNQDACVKCADNKKSIKYENAGYVISIIIYTFLAIMCWLKINIGVLGIVIKIPYTLSIIAFIALNIGLIKGAKIGGGAKLIVFCVYIFVCIAQLIEIILTAAYEGGSISLLLGIADLFVSITLVWFTVYKLTNLIKKSMNSYKSISVMSLLLVGIPILDICFYAISLIIYSVFDILELGLVLIGIIIWLIIENLLDGHNVRLHQKGAFKTIIFAVYTLITLVLIIWCDMVKISLIIAFSSLVLWFVLYKFSQWMYKYYLFSNEKLIAKNKKSSKAKINTKCDE